MRRYVVPALKTLPFAIGVAMCAYGIIRADSAWTDRGHNWINTGFLVWLMFGMRRLLTDWPLGEIFGAGFDLGKKHKRRTASTLRSLPPADDALPATPRHDRGRFRA